MSTNRKIAKASIILIIVSILGYFLSISKEMVVASSFGIARSVDAFYSALTVSNLAGNLLLGSFSTLFIPIFIKQLIADKRQANILASVAINYLFLGLIALTAAVYLFAHPIIALAFHGLGADTISLTANILKILSITIICMGAVGVITGIMNSYEQFTVPALSQIIINLCIILFVVLLSGKTGIFSLVWGQALGFVLQVLLLLYFVRRTGFEYFFTFDLNQPALKGILGLMLIYSVGTLIFIGNSLVNRVMAAYLPAGSIAALAYADKLVQVPQIIFAGSISTVMYPFFAQQFAGNELEKLKDTFASGVKMAGALFIPTAVFIMLFSRPLVHALFQRGAFDARATELTATILVCYSFQLFYVFISSIMIKVYFTIQDFLTALKVSAAALLLTIIFNLVFMKIIDPPAAGIAVATSLSGLAACLLYFYFLKKKITNMHGLSIVKFLLKITIIAAVTGTTIKILSMFWQGIFGTSLFQQLYFLGASALLGAVMFVWLAYLFKIKEIRSFHALMKNWWISKTTTAEAN
jgi:putative peptidoglycan lipid II flippase